MKSGGGIFVNGETFFKANKNDLHEKENNFNFYWTVVSRLVIWIIFLRNNCTYPNPSSFLICKWEICKWKRQRENDGF